MRLLEIADNMLGFLVRQPIHVSLRQMRIVPIYLIFSSQDILLEIVRNLKIVDPVQSAIAYSTIAVTLITCIWQGLKYIREGNVKDDE